MSSTPERVTLRRTKGWRIPENTRIVSRPSKWGNPFRAGKTDESRAEAVRRFEVALMAGDLGYSTLDVVDRLAGLNLACWCPPGAPCHAEVLLRVANAPTVAACSSTTSASVSTGSTISTT